MYGFPLKSMDFLNVWRCLGRFKYLGFGKLGNGELEIWRFLSGDVWRCLSWDVVRFGAIWWNTIWRCLEISGDVVRFGNFWWNGLGIWDLMNLVLKSMDFLFDLIDFLQQLQNFLQTLKDFLLKCMDFLWNQWICHLEVLQSFGIDANP